MGRTQSSESEVTKPVGLQKSSSEAFLLAEVKKETAKFMAAQKAINEIDDFFEYPYRSYTLDGTREKVREILAGYVRRLSEILDE